MVPYALVCVLTFTPLKGGDTEQQQYFTFNQRCAKLHPWQFVLRARRLPRLSYFTPVNSKSVAKSFEAQMSIHYTCMLHYWFHWPIWSLGSAPAEAVCADFQSDCFCCRKPCCPGGVVGSAGFGNNNKAPAGIEFNLTACHHDGEIYPGTDWATRRCVRCVCVKTDYKS